MAINWGIALGAAAKTGMQTYDQLQNDKLKQMQYQEQLTQYQNQQAQRQALSQLDPNDPSYATKVQQVMTQYDPLKGAQYGQAAAQTTGLNLSNQDTQALQTSLQNARGIYGQATAAGSMALGGDTQGALKLIMQADPSAQLSPDGKTLTIGGETVDTTNAHAVAGVAHTIGLNAIGNTLFGSGSVAGTRMGIQALQAGADVTRAQATQQDADTRATIAPSEIARNDAGANASNAEAALAPQRGALYAAQQGNLDAEAAGRQFTVQQQQQAGQLFSQAQAADAAGDHQKAESMRQQATFLASPNGYAYARAYGGANTAAARGAASASKNGFALATPDQLGNIKGATIGIFNKGTGTLMVANAQGQKQWITAGANGSQKASSAPPLMTDASGKSMYAGADGYYPATPQGQAAAAASYDKELQAQQQPQQAVPTPNYPTIPPLPPGYGASGYGQQAPMPQGPVTGGSYDDQQY
jgi:hypothetical protein